MPETRNTLSIGDVANLRSGGPAMTVTRFEKEDGAPMDGPDLSPHGRDGLVRCIWFDEGGRLQAHAFPHALLDGASKAPDEKPDTSGQGTMATGKRDRVADKAA